MPENSLYKEDGNYRISDQWLGRWKHEHEKIEITEQVMLKLYTSIIHVYTRKVPKGISNLINFSYNQTTLYFERMGKGERL